MSAEPEIEDFVCHSSRHAFRDEDWDRIVAERGRLGRPLDEEDLDRLGIPPAAERISP